MLEIVPNYKEHLLSNLIYDEDFYNTNKIYIDLVITKDLKVMLIPNKIDLNNPMIDLEIRGFEVVTIPTHINLLSENDFIYDLSYNSLIKKLPKIKEIKKMLNENKSLINDLKNSLLINKFNEKYENS